MIYADTGIVIRLIEGAAKVRNPIESRLKSIHDSRPLIATSRLTRLECRCRPLRKKQEELLRLYDAFFIGPDVHVVEIDATIVEKATELRAFFGLKTPDAIHAATALRTKVSEFWTVDQGFSRCPELNVIMFDAV